MWSTWMGPVPGYRAMPPSSRPSIAAAGPGSESRSPAVCDRRRRRGHPRSGAARVVLGTTALRDPAFVAALVRDVGPDRIAVAIDVRDGEARGDGWQSDGTARAVETAMTALAEAGVRTFEVTAIERDGLGGGPDVELYGRLVAMGIGRIIASGGIATADDVAEVRSIGCAGAIIGRALYDGRLRLADILDVSGHLIQADRSPGATPERAPPRVAGGPRVGVRAAQAGTASNAERTQRTPLS